MLSVWRHDELAANDLELQEAVAAATRVSFKVFDQHGTEIAGGAVGGDAVSVSSGTYTVEVNTVPVARYENVAVVALETATIDLDESQVDTPEALLPNDTGLIANDDDVIIEPQEDSQVIVARENNQGTAVLRITLRACPDDVVPQSVNPASTCTIPLDAPDASRLAWGGGQGGMIMPGQYRLYDGTYEVLVPANTEVSLVSFEPVLRDGFMATGVSGFDASGDPVITLAPGATGHIYLYYYYAAS